MELFSGPDGEDEDVNEDGNKTSDCNRVEALHGSSNRVAHPVARHNEETVCEEDDPESVLVWDEGRPQLHERGDGSCVNMKFNENNIK